MAISTNHLPQHVAVASLLIDLQAEMSRLNLWEDTEPSAEALNSSQPFCIDTLSFSQWIQFVFIRRLYIIVDNQHPLPTKSNVAAMAEEYFRSQALDASNIIAQLRALDKVLEGEF